MKTSVEIRNELIAAFDNKVLRDGSTGLKVNGLLLSASPQFDDYVRIGRCLSKGARNRRVLAALQSLENSMIDLCGLWYDKSARATTHFNSIANAYTNNSAPPTKSRDCSKLLSRALENFERAHGFQILGEKLPNYAGFVFGNVFKEGLSQKQHWKDVGAGASHGEFTHRLQWYVVIAAGAIQTTGPFQEADIFASIAPWQKGTTNLWTFLFDLLKTDGSIGGDKWDFRSPENFNDWLTGDENPGFCPVLRAFLRARKAKRGTYNLTEYLGRKLKLSAEDVDAIVQSIQVMSAQQINSSYRIVYPTGEKPSLSKFAS